ncbi:MAG: AzlC family ABC transporter permease [Clostridia bacterium]|nr:AzlC family ABC transporter permease [Clostridia bacterium]
MTKDFLQGFKAGLPVGLGYFSVAFAFGVAAVQNGLTVLNAVLISLTNLTSAGQLAGLSVIALFSCAGVFLCEWLMILL